MDLLVKDLSLTIEEKQILKDISLDIESREFVGIIGPNGSGKSSLLKTIYRVLRPSEGEIYINQKEIRSYSLKETAREMAVVAQHNEQNFDFSVIDMVLIGRSPHKKFMEGNTREDYQMALDALRQVDMEDFIDRDFNSLSGGEKQRIVLARALAQDTNCLILDEPTNHLDIKYQIQFMNIARKLGITVIAAIHDLNLASLFCTRLYVLKEGRLIKSGRPEEILTEELIYETYGVRSRIIKDEDGSLNIIYKI